MALNINSSNNSGISTLFSSLNSGSSSSGSDSLGLSSLLSDYASIKNGSYAKLAKQYYAKNSDSKTSTNKDITGQFSEGTSTDIKVNKSMISDASGLKSAVSSLQSDDALFTDKVKVKDEKGNETESIDYDKIYKKISSFVDSYNSMVEAGGDSEDTTVLRNTLNMTNATERNSALLKKAGITINSDNTLSVEKDDIKNADMNAMKSLFGSTASYAKAVDTAATNIASKSAQNVYSLGGYTSNGAYKQVLEGIYNTTV